MEDTDLLKAAGFSTTGMAIVLVVYRILKSVKGKRFVSSCCGKKLEMGMDVEEMTPKGFAAGATTEVVVANPIPLRRAETTGLQD